MAIKYCASLVDVTAKKAAEEVGSTGTKLVLGAATTWFFGQSEPVRTLAGGLKDLAELLIKGALN